MGEAALLSGARRGATVVCTSHVTQALYLLKDDFDEVTKPVSVRPLQVVPP